MTEDILAALQQGLGVWLKGAPGSGRTHAMRQAAERWPGGVLWLDGPQDWLAAVPTDNLVCVDDAPAGLASAAFKHPVIAAGPRPGPGWKVLELAPLERDAALALFLQLTPGLQDSAALRALLRRLDGHPTALVAAARRWPEHRIEAILADPIPEWPGLRESWGALTDAERAALSLLCHLPGSAQRAGLDHCGHGPALGGLLATGWARVESPGELRVMPAIAEVLRDWQAADRAPYLDWLRSEAQARIARWDSQGGSKQWFRCGLWPEITQDQPWQFLAWSLSGEDPQGLLERLQSAPLQPVLSARCAARAHQSLGDRRAAADTLAQALKGPNAEPHDAAIARLELALAHHRLRDSEPAHAAYQQALSELEAQDLRRARSLCLANLAALDHDLGRHEAALAGYQQAQAQTLRLGDDRVRGILHSNQGALLLELDRVPEARAAFQRAVACLTRAPDRRYLAITRVNQGAAELLEDHLEAADQRYRQALRLLGDGDPGSAALCHARRSAVAALRADLEAARAHHDRAEAALPAGDPLAAQLVAGWRAVLEWEAGDLPSALGRRLVLIEQLADRSDDARLLLRLLERRALGSGQCVLVGAGGAWIQLPGQARQEVLPKAAHARILASLAQAAEQGPNMVREAEDLIEAGWPGERIQYSAAKNRLAVALSGLRKLGLKELIQRHEQGWRLDPGAAVVLLRSDA